jgi:hypothetical protein
MPRAPNRVFEIAELALLVFQITSRAMVLEWLALVENYST